MRVRKSAATKAALVVAAPLLAALAPAQPALAGGTCASPAGDLTTITTVTVSGAVSTGDTSDWYSATIDASQAAAFILQGGGGNADLYVWNPTCTNVICTSTQASATEVCAGIRTDVFNATLKVEVRYVDSPSGTVTYDLHAVL